MLGGELTGWSLRVGRYRIILEAPSKEAATYTLINQCDRIAHNLNSVGMWECLIFFPNCKKPYRIPATLLKQNEQNEGNMTDINKAKIIDGRLFLNSEIYNCIDTTLIKVAEKLINLATDGIPGGLVTSPGLLKPNYQIWVNEPTEQLFKSAGRELIQVNTNDFWHPSDRERFYQIIKDKNPGTKFDFTYKAQGTPTDPDYWLQLTNEVEIIETNGTNGQRFRLFTSKDAKVIPKPVIA